MNRIIPYILIALSMLSPLSAAACDISTGLVGEWPLNNLTSTSTAFDVSGNGNNGVGAGTISTSTGAGQIYPPAHDAQLFQSGLNGNYSLGQNVAALQPTAGFTISAWVQFNGATTGQNQIFSSYSQNSGGNWVNGISMALSVVGNSAHNPGCVIGHTNSTTTFQYTFVNGSVAADDGSWHFLTCDYNYDGAQSLSINYNGVNNAHVTAQDPLYYSCASPSGPACGGNSYAYIGAINQSGSTAGFISFNSNVYLQDVRLYDRGLSSSDLTCLYAYTGLLSGNPAIVFDAIRGIGSSVALWVARGVGNAVSLYMP